MALQMGFRINPALLEKASKLSQKVLIRFVMVIGEVNAKAMTESAEQRPGFRSRLMPDNVPVSFCEQAR